MEREIAVPGGAGWAEALVAWDRRLDPAAATRASELFEALALDAPGEPDAWAWCARARFYLGDHEPDAGWRRAHFERGTTLGRRGVDRDTGHSGALFWTSVCEASWVDEVGLLRGATSMPGIMTRMKHLWQREPLYYHRGAARLLGQALVRQPTLVGRFLPLFLPHIGPGDVIRELRQTIAEGPPIVLAYQTLGEVMYAIRGDRTTAREMLAAIEMLDVDADPNLAPENRRDRPRAIRILEAIE